MWSTSGSHVFRRGITPKLKSHKMVIEIEFFLYNYNIYQMSTVSAAILRAVLLPPGGTATMVAIEITGRCAST